MPQMFNLDCYNTFGNDRSTCSTAATPFVFQATVRWAIVGPTFSLVCGLARRHLWKTWLQVASDAMHSLDCRMAEVSIRLGR